MRNLEGANQEVPQNLLDLAMQSAWFRKSRFKSGKGKKVNVGGRGLGYRERPGLGSSDNQTNAGSGMVPNSIADLIPKPVRTGPGTDRLSAMKAAFRSQYMSQVRIQYIGTNLIDLLCLNFHIVEKRPVKQTFAMCYMKTARGIFIICK